MTERKGRQNTAEFSLASMFSFIEGLNYDVPGLASVVILPQPPFGLCTANLFAHRHFGKRQRKFRNSGGRPAGSLVVQMSILKFALELMNEFV